MPYLGRSTDGFGVRDRFVFTASGSETSLSGSDDNSRTLKYQDGTYIDVFMNGVLLLRGTDYNTTTANTIAGLASLAANDIVEIIVYDVFSVANTVPQTGGEYTGSVVFNSNITVDGNVNDEGLFDDRTIMLDGTDSSFSNEGSKILLDGTDSNSDNSGERLLFETDTLSSLIKEDPDVIVLEDNDENGLLLQNTSTSSTVGVTKIVLERGTNFEIPNTLTAPKVTGVAEIANVGGDQNTNFDNSVSVDIKAMSLAAGSHILDLDRNANFQLTLSGNITLVNPANLTAGTTGSIFIIQDGTGSRTASFGTSWDFIGGTAPTLTTTASAVDRIDYIVLDSTNIHAVATLAYS
tara:strand:+ start:541 stop:1593 length:1053 start_codon:yes stop_codon:yes gene_type:complete